MKKLVIIAFASTLSLSAIAGGEHQHGDMKQAQAMRGEVMLNVLQMTKLQLHMQSMQKIISDLKQHPMQNKTHIEGIEQAMNLTSTRVNSMMNQMMDLQSTNQIAPRPSH